MVREEDATSRRRMEGSEGAARPDAAAVATGAATELRRQAAAAPAGRTLRAERRARDAVIVAVSGLVVLVAVAR